MPSDDTKPTPTPAAKSKLRIPPKINLLKFHKPKLHKSAAAYRITGADGGAAPQLKEESKNCIRNLSTYRPPKRRFKLPRTRSAAVLVALFVGRLGDLYVLLSKRSATLRTYAGDTSLPGGKVDPYDQYIEDTARREAFEEIGLPLDRTRVPLLCVLEPFLAGMNASDPLIVIPVVVLILDNTLRPILNSTEVASLFSHPLASFLTSTPPFPSESESVEFEYHTYSVTNVEMDLSADIGTRAYVGTPTPASTHSYRRDDTPRVATGRIRMHRFLTGREAGGIKPVFGLTAAILIRVATIGYGRSPTFAVDIAGGPTMEERIAYALVRNDRMGAALRAEGLVKTRSEEAVEGGLMRELEARVERLRVGRRKDKGQEEEEDEEEDEGVTVETWRSRL